jgi:hypothetical protein
MRDSVLAQIAAIKGASIVDIRGKWKELFGKQSPKASRDYLVSRLAYRIQELAYGGLRPETLARLEAIADDLEKTERPRKGAPDRPIAGTRLIREWNGVEHCVTVLRDGFEYQGRPYRSLSAIARAITGTRWNGPLFFGLRNTRGDE